MDCLGDPTDGALCAVRGLRPAVLEVDSTLVDTLRLGFNVALGAGGLLVVGFSLKRLIDIETRSLPDKLLELGVLGAICAPSIFPFIHCAVHASFKESSCRIIRSWSGKLIEFIDVTVKVAPQESGFTVAGPGPEFQFFTYQKDTLGIS